MLTFIESDPETGLDRIVKIDPDNIAPCAGVSHNGPTWFSRWTGVTETSVAGDFRVDHDLIEVREDNS